MQKILETLDKAFIVISLLYFTSTLNFFGGISSADNPALRDSGDENSAVLSLMQYVILGITFLLTCIRSQRIAYLASKRRFLWALVALAILSFLWSPIPDVTLRKAIVFLGLILFGLNVAARYTLEEQLRLLCITMGLIILINVVFTLSLPWAAIESGEHQGA
ncbi:hypothetical protein H6G26_17165, partial [Nostoc sp. FACHB-888]|nr:hypothetical protein [Nostoc sp. FACHB-888]